MMTNIRNKDGVDDEDEGFFSGGYISSRPNTPGPDSSDRWDWKSPVFKKSSHRLENHSWFKMCALNCKHIKSGAGIVF